MLFQWDLWNCVIFIFIKHYTGLVGLCPFQGHERVWEKETNGGCNGPLFVRHQFSLCSPWYSAWQDTKIQRRLVIAVQDPRWAGGTGHGAGAPSHRLHPPTPHQPPHLRHRCPATRRHPGWDTELVPLTVLKSACSVRQRERGRESAVCGPELLQGGCSPSERGCVVCVCRCASLCVLLNFGCDLMPQCVLSPPEWDRECVAFVDLCAILPFTWCYSETERVCCICFFLCMILPFTWCYSVCLVHQSETERGCVIFVGLCV